MPLLLLALFIGVPILEIAILIEVGGWIGLWPTIGLIVLTAVVGTALLRQQGLAALARAQDNLDRGVLPVKEVFDGLCLMAGGALLLTPGFVTDAVGFALLLPPLRAVLRRAAGHRVEMHRFGGPGQAHDPHGPHGPEPEGTVIDAEFEEVDGSEPDTPEAAEERRRLRRDGVEPDRET